jgi:hypothetical protein
MQAVARLHGQVGGLAARLREAAADAEGTRALLQRERREAEARAGALRGRLDEAASALRDLAGDHESLRAAHAQLVARELAAAGLLKDRRAGARARQRRMRVG